MHDLPIRNIKGKLLRCGYTTGSAATAAAKAAAIGLLSGKPVETVTIDTPKGIMLTLGIADLIVSGGAECPPRKVACAVRKDSGDDPDATNGALIYATVRKIESTIMIDGGEGVGRVTRKGLDQPVGNAAINSTPRKMIASEVSGVCKEYGYTGGVEVVISVPNGEELAKKTRGGQLGIVGGISIIGTTGIVEPMSTKALVDTIRTEIKAMSVHGERNLLITPGNYGETFSKDTLKMSMNRHIRAADFIGDTIDSAVENGFGNILLVSHIGKAAKLGTGAFNTHYSFGDGRMETLAACALGSGADNETLKKIMDCVMADAALDVLRAANLLEGAMGILGKRIEGHLTKRVPENIDIGFICFTNAPAPQILCQSGNANGLRRLFE
jgi:cobalt-precorrin-5B (C1)-methyltransferase